MTGKPETLEAALAWLAEQYGDISFGVRGMVVSGAECCAVWDFDGDIPAAIVEAVGDVWEQVHGDK